MTEINWIDDVDRGTDCGCECHDFYDPDGLGCHDGYCPECGGEGGGHEMMPERDDDEDDDQ